MHAMGDTETLHTGHVIQHVDVGHIVGNTEILYTRCLGWPAMGDKEMCHTGRVTDGIRDLPVLDTDVG